MRFGQRPDLGIANLLPSDDAFLLELMKAIVSCGAMTTQLISDLGRPKTRPLEQVYDLLSRVNLLISPRICVTAARHRSTAGQSPLKIYPELGMLGQD